jgi:hypothetical protein
VNKIYFIFAIDDEGFNAPDLDDESDPDVLHASQLPDTPILQFQTQDAPGYNTPV